MTVIISVGRLVMKTSYSARGRFVQRVTTGKAQSEPKISALAPKPDIDGLTCTRPSLP